MEESFDAKLIVFQCTNCTHFLTTQQGAKEHIRKCKKLGTSQSQDTIQRTADAMSPDDKEYCDTQIHRVTFRTPRVVLKRLEIAVFEKDPASASNCVTKRIINSVPKHEDEIGNENGRGGIYGKARRQSSLKAEENIRKVSTEPMCSNRKREKIEATDLDWKADNAQYETEGLQNGSEAYPSRRQVIYKCPICDRMLQVLQSFQSHLACHSDAEDCEEAFNLWNQWPDFPQKTVVRFSCKYCLAPCCSFEGFIKHMRKHHAVTGAARACTWPCRYCSPKVEFDSIKEYVLHIMKNHVDDSMETNPRLGRLRKAPVASSSSMMECDICLQKIAVDYLEAHKEAHSSAHADSFAGMRERKNKTPLAKCDICHKIVDRYYLKKHKARHQNIELHSSRGKSTAGTKINKVEDYIFKCPLKSCAARLKNTASLKNHFVLHLENNPFACKVPGCGVKCDAQCHLNRHMKLHMGELNVKCEKCGVAYARQDRLIDHVCKPNSDSSRSAYSHLRLKRVTQSQDKSSLEEGKALKGKQKRLNITQIILADPVFKIACKEDSQFRNLILGKQLHKIGKKGTEKKQGRNRNDTKRFLEEGGEDSKPIIDPESLVSIVKVEVDPFFITDGMSSDNILVEPKTEANMIIDVIKTEPEESF